MACFPSTGGQQGPRSFSSPAPLPGLRWVCPTMASSPSPHTRGPAPARGLGQVGKGLSTYLAPWRKQHLLRFEASILYPLLLPIAGGPQRPMGSAGVGRTGCFPILLQALRIGGCRGRGQRGHTAGEEDAVMWVQEDLVLAHNRKQLKGLLPGLWCRRGSLAGTVSSALHTRERHPPCPPASAVTKALEPLWAQGAAASSGAAPEGTELDFHGQSILFACKSPKEGGVPAQAPAPSASCALSPPHPGSAQPASREMLPELRQPQGS